MNLVELKDKKNDDEWQMRQVKPSTYPNNCMSEFC